jgi:hypothetical protein
MRSIIYQCAPLVIGSNHGSLTHGSIPNKLGKNFYSDLSSQLYFQIFCLWLPEPPYQSIGLPSGPRGISGPSAQLPARQRPQEYARCHPCWPIRTHPSVRGSCAECLRPPGKYFSSSPKNGYGIKVAYTLWIRRISHYTPPNTILLSLPSPT